ncbi:MAG: RiPP maturation radical SAM C-methyltransferase [Schwartzia sp.]|nr:RiPP maturation radical SAM C-methyltransferase [Schwartzia sp. (in: firmicutes)]
MAGKNLCGGAARIGVYSQDCGGNYLDGHDFIDRGEKRMTKELDNNEKVDVLLVTMPFCDEYMPCITLALFKAILAQAGIKSRVQHEFLYFADRIGTEKYRAVMQVCTIGYGHDYFACETIFADAAHDGRQLRSFDEYLRWMREEHLPGKAFAGNQRDETLEKLALFEEAHGMAEDYLDETVQRVKASGAKIVAFLSMYQQQNATIALAKRLKKEKDAPIVMAGGANCEGDAGQAMIEYFDCFDYIFTGEADEILAPMCERILKDGAIPDAELPDGVVSRTRITAPPAKVTQNLDALPLPDFSDYYRERGVLLPKEADNLIITLEDSRGCWWAAKHPCRFCGLNGSTAHLYREKSVERLADEITELSTLYPGAQCYFTGNVMSMKHQKGLPEALKKRPAYWTEGWNGQRGLRLFSEIKSPVPEEDVERLARIGFFWVQAGIESFSDDRLRLMGKGVSAIRQVETLKHCYAYDVDVLWYILLGLPGETDEMIVKDIEVIPKIMHLSPPNTVAQMMYLRYNYYMDHPEDGGAPKLRPDRGYDFVFPDREFIRRAVHLYAPEDEEELAKYYDYRLRGPSYEKLYRLSEAWRNEPQMLFMKDNGDVVKVLDTRLIAKSPLYHIKGAEADVLRACRNTTKERKVFELLSDCYPAEEIREALVKMEGGNMLLRIGDELLTLPVDRGVRLQKRD